MKLYMNKSNYSRNIPNEYICEKCGRTENIYIDNGNSNNNANLISLNIGGKTKLIMCPGK